MAYMAQRQAGGGKAEGLDKEDMAQRQAGGGKAEGLEKEEVQEGVDEDERKWRLLGSEALAIIAIMRQNARFQSGSAEHELVTQLNGIRHHVKKPETLKTGIFVAPFVDLITSAEVCA